MSSATDELEALYRSAYPSSVRLALLLVGDPRAAEDLAQDAFVRIAPRLAGLDRPEAYLRTVVVNLCRDHGRRAATVRAQPAPRPVHAAEPPLPDELGTAWVALQALPIAQREAIVLRYWADLETSEIAHLLSVPHPTIRTRIRRGLAALRKALADER
ncbi:MAG: sigma-70 family RNA polymerase sigma factor [Acidimicrobiales bacterium]|nr:sigma-70 family RNA polymerase sigma factor [Acidimicrobiales bacterium]HRW37370.1 sigma-70 family RNA polymerase sigma factor [Aquihabitans sp.]